MAEWTIVSTTEHETPEAEHRNTLKAIHELFAAEHPLDQLRDWATWFELESARDGMTYYVASAGEQVVGYLSCQLVDEESKLCFLDAWVLASHRRQGIGRALFDQMRSDWPEYSFNAAVASAAGSESSAAKGFLRAGGWASFHSTTLSSFTGELSKENVHVTAKEARAACADLRIKTHGQELPEALKAQVAVTNMFVEDPELQDTQELDAEFVQECLADLDDEIEACLDNGCTPLFTTVRDADDALVAFTFDEIPQDSAAEVSFGMMRALGPVPDGTQTAMVLSALRAVTVLYPGFTDFEVGIAGEDLGTLNLLAALKKLGFVVEHQVEYFQWSYFQAMLEASCGEQPQA